MRIQRFASLNKDRYVIIVEVDGPDMKDPDYHALVSTLDTLRVKRGLDAD